MVSQPSVLFRLSGRPSETSRMLPCRPRDRVLVGHRIGKRSLPRPGRRSAQLPAERVGCLDRGECVVETCWNRSVAPAQQVDRRQLTRHREFDRDNPLTNSTRSRCCSPAALAPTMNGPRAHCPNGIAATGRRVTRPSARTRGVRLHAVRDEAPWDPARTLLEMEREDKYSGSAAGSPPSTSADAAAPPGKINFPADVCERGRVEVSELSSCCPHIENGHHQRRLCSDTFVDGTHRYRLQPMSIVIRKVILVRRG